MEAMIKHTPDEQKFREYITGKHRYHHDGMTVEETARACKCSMFFVHRSVQKFRQLLLARLLDTE